MGYSVQNTKSELFEHVHRLSKNDQAFRGRQAARTTFLYYCHMVAANDNAAEGFRRLHVMPHVTGTKLVSEYTDLTPKTVNDANNWLHEQGFIRWMSVPGSQYPDIEILSYDGESEAKRKGNAPYPPREVRVGRPPRRTGKCGNDTSGLSKDTSGGISGPEMPPEVDHALQSSLHPVDAARAQPAPTARAASGVDVDRKENQGEARSGPGESALRPAGRRGSSQPAQFGEDAAVDASDFDLEADLQAMDEHLGQQEDRAERASQGYVNDFWVGLSKGGEAYFTRTTSRRRNKHDEGQITLSPAEASRFFTLRRTDRIEFEKYRQELYDKYGRKIAA